MNIKKLLFILTLILSLSFASDVITFQGRLIDSTGAAVNGYRTMGFKIYDSASGENLILTIPKNDEVLCNDGNYAVLINLDSVNSLQNQAEAASISLNNLTEAWIEVYVGDRNANVYDINGTYRMSPRISLTATPYAVSAKQIQGLDIKRFKTGVTDNMEFYY